jgi:hypothetical protein
MQVSSLFTLIYKKCRYSGLIPDPAAGQRLLERLPLAGRKLLAGLALALLDCFVHVHGRVVTAVVIVGNKPPKIIFDWSFGVFRG